MHIDFGHFLGHVKRAMGVNRDKSPFILTDDFLVIMGGKEGAKSDNFQRFESLCCDLFNVIRKNANLFINMMSLVSLHYSTHASRAVRICVEANYCSVETLTNDSLAG